MVPIKLARITCTNYKIHTTECIKKTEVKATLNPLSKQILNAE